MKIIMVTVNNDYENINTAFREQCEAYVRKLINRNKSTDVLMKLSIINNL